ncbi:MAG TPA: PHP domain-containing protein, partial [Actinobacteria bacterium]|nr:PHP domain-containing protein [Actinomycetota bacterium]
MAVRPVIDLHTHSAASDGTDPPEAIPRLAAEAGLSAVALTDHDTLAGIPEATRAAAAVGVELVPGVELSVRHGEAKLHLLVYFLEPDDGPLQRRLAELRAGRSERNVEILRRLAALGYPLELDEVLAQAKGDAVGRPHIADALVARGWFPDRSAAFAALLRDGGPAYVERRRLEAVEAIELAAASGAVAAVAHPSTISANRAGYADLFRSLAEVGLVGIEVDHPEHDPA